jgi:hypothetical protein
MWHKECGCDFYDETIGRHRNYPDVERDAMYRDAMLALEKCGLLKQAIINGQFRAQALAARPSQDNTAEQLQTALREAVLALHDKGHTIVLGGACDSDEQNAYGYTLMSMAGLLERHSAHLSANPDTALREAAKAGAKALRYLSGPNHSPVEREYTAYADLLERFAGGCP